MDILTKKLETEGPLVKSDNSNYNNLLVKLINMHLHNIVSKKKKSIEQYFTQIEKDENKLKEINSILDLSNDKKVTINDVNKLANYGIDLYLDLYMHKDKNVNL